MMNAETKKTVLRMLPHGLYILTVEDEGDNAEVAAATVSWLSQASFEPPLLMIALKKDSGIYRLVKKRGRFALNMLAKNQGELAKTFFKRQVREGNLIGGEPFERSEDGLLLLTNTPAWLACEVVSEAGGGDHIVFIVEVKDVGLRQEIEGRPDEFLLNVRDLGGKIFYGG